MTRSPAPGARGGERTRVLEQCEHGTRDVRGHRLGERLPGHLELLGEEVDAVALAVGLGMIAGLVMYGWILGHSAVIHPDPAERGWAREELGWWVPRARRALETWSPA